MTRDEERGLWTRRRFLETGLLAGAGTVAGLWGCGDSTSPFLEGGGPSAWIAEQVKGRVTDGSGNVGLPGALIWFRAAFVPPPRGPGYVPLGGARSGIDGRYEIFAKDQNGYAGFWRLFVPADLPRDLNGDITVHLQLEATRDGFEPKEILWDVKRRPQVHVPTLSEVFRIHRNVVMD